jgi:hypothetical protein
MACYGMKTAMAEIPPAALKDAVDIGHRLAEVERVDFRARTN